MELLLALPKTACRAERSDRAGLVGLAPGHEVPACQAFRAPSLDSLGDAEMEGASVASGLSQQTPKIIWLGKEGRASFRRRMMMMMINTMFQALIMGLAGC